MTNGLEIVFRKNIFTLLVINDYLVYSDYCTHKKMKK